MDRNDHALGARSLALVASDRIGKIEIDQMFFTERLQLAFAVEMNGGGALGDIDRRDAPEHSVEQPGAIVVSAEDDRLTFGKPAAEEPLQLVMTVCDVTPVETLIDALDADGA